MTIPDRIDADKFRDFEHAGWQAVPDQYHQAWGSLTRQAVEPLLDAVKIEKGIKLLDVASGPGYVAEAAANRGAVVIGVDFSAAMVADARRRAPGAEFREGDAEDLPFGDAFFDAVVMNFGMLHLGRPERALIEARRVLRAGGRFAFTVWATPEEAIGFRIVLRAVESYGQTEVPLPPGPPFFRFSDPAEAKRSFEAAGFQPAEVKKIVQVWRLPAGDGLFEAMRDGTVRTAGLLRAQKPEALTRIRDAIREATQSYTKGDVVELPMPAMLASAMKA